MEIRNLILVAVFMQSQLKQTEAIASQRLFSTSVIFVSRIVRKNGAENSKGFARIAEKNGETKNEFFSWPWRDFSGNKQLGQFMMRARVQVKRARLFAALRSETQKDAIAFCVYMEKLANGTRSRAIKREVGERGGYATASLERFDERAVAGC